MDNRQPSQSYYDFKVIEGKWQAYWTQHQTFRTRASKGQPTYYVLDMFPYPSGAGLHVGHTLGYIASDVIARHKRSQGYNVLHPMGFDAFGLPAEQYAIQTGQHPAVTTAQNIGHYRSQLQRLGISFDWHRTVCTSDPAYYRWTQWIFVKLFQSWYDTDLGKARPIQTLIARLSREGNQHIQAACDTDTPTITAHTWQKMSQQQQQAFLLKYRLAFLEATIVNWCPTLGTVLANEEVKDGLSERGGYPVIRKKMRQWSLRITAYAARLLQDLAHVDWPESIKEMQRHWIGMSKGATITFYITAPDGTKHALPVFTSRPETLFGVTYLALAPEHPLVQTLTQADQQTAVQDYIHQVKNRSDKERLANIKYATGVFTGTYAQHPFMDQQLPIWITDYVMAGYGTGAIMGVPAHNQRDYTFAQQLGLPMVQVIEGGDITHQAHETDTGRLVNTDFLNGLTLQDAKKVVVQQLITKKIGKATTAFRLRDAIFSRQRYWGEPLPIYYKDNLPYTLSEETLPLLLPPISTYQPTSTGLPPLGHAKDWHTEAGDPLELHTMPGWAGSSWYFLRYMDPHNDQTLVSLEAQKHWRAVDLYIGGAEHTTGHLLYARFFTKFLYDLGHVTTQEPFHKLLNQGMIQNTAHLVYYIKESQQFVSAHLREQYDTLSMYIPSNLVKNHVLDIAAFKHWRPDLKKATFILENDQYVCGSGIEKMSKSKHNVIDPDSIIAQYGADTLRLYILFLGPLEQSKIWDTHGIDGIYRFLSKLWRLYHPTAPESITDTTPPAKALKTLHQTIKKVQEAIARHAFNTAISAFMICVNKFTAWSCHHRSLLEDLIVLLAPFAPHIAEELWQRLGHTTSILDAPCATWEDIYIQEEHVEYPITVNGKLRTKLVFSRQSTVQEIEQQLRQHKELEKWTQRKSPKKIVIIPQRIVNIVV